MANKGRGICPECGSRNSIPIIYGFPSSQAYEEEQQGKVLLGGCCAEADSPEYACKDCYCQWGGEQPLIKSYQDIKIITASAGGYPGPFFEVGINLVKLEARWKKQDSNTEGTKDRHLNKEELTLFVQRMEKCNLLEWGQRYYMPACDGTSWMVYIDFGDAIMHKEGSNAFPRQWEEFCSLISDTVGAEFF